jgi:hypothetical protein
MRLTIERKSEKVYPDTKRVIARFFFNGEERASHIINRVMVNSETGYLQWLRQPLYACGA